MQARKRAIVNASELGDMEERVVQIWASATIADDGSARIHEVIDYDFGGYDRHGIFRDIPTRLRFAQPIDVSANIGVAQTGRLGNVGVRYSSRHALFPFRFLLWCAFSQD